MTSEHRIEDRSGSRVAIASRFTCDVCGKTADRPTSAIRPLYDRRHDRVLHACVGECLLELGRKVSAW